MNQKWNTVDTKCLKYYSITLTDLLNWVKENAPNSNNDDILLNFEIDYYEDHNDYGDKYTNVIAELQLQVKIKK